MKHPLGSTSNGIPVYVDLIHSKAATHIAQHPHILNLIKEVLPRTTGDGERVSVEHDMGRPIGYSFIVQTGDQDHVLYAKILHDEMYTRFVKNGKPLPSHYLTIILRYDDNKEYELLDTWIGHTHPPQPGSYNETSDSRPYWESHAHVLDVQVLQRGTATKDCPY
jgi:hypothetical protein